MGLKRSLLSVNVVIGKCQISCCIPRRKGGASADDQVDNKTSPEKIKQSLVDLWLKKLRKRRGEGEPAPLATELEKKHPP